MISKKPATALNWHHLSEAEFLHQLDVNPQTGLTDCEVAQRQQKFGFNRISPRRGTPQWLRFLQQFNQPLVYILLTAVGITAALGEWVDASVIFGVVLINSIVGYLQESKAENAISALSSMITTRARVRRDGHMQQIDSEQLVPGDVVLLQAGDRVPADLRLFHPKNLQVDESALTGESVPVIKIAGSLALDAVLAERKNLAFTGTVVTAGQSEGIVWATGDSTETGHIAALISETVELSTPLTRKIAHFSKILVWVILSLAATTFLVGLLRGEDFSAMFMAAVALAVGAIPEGLPAAVTIVLAIGVSRMARRRAIIRKLPAVETLGSTTVICSDKTGTLTENQMTVREVYAGGQTYEVTGEGYAPLGDILFAGALIIEMQGHPTLAEVLRAGVLCNDSQLDTDEKGRTTAQGDPSEAALLTSGAKGGFNHIATHQAAPRVDVIPFESEHMFRATLHDASEGRVIYKIGAVEKLLDRCGDTLGRRGERVALDKRAVLQTVEQMAARGLRVLAIVRREVEATHGTLEHHHVREGLTFLGLQGMIDPPRAEAIAAINRCQKAGILVKMITGDHLVTARAIAEQIGLKGHQEHNQLTAITGRELAAVPDEDLPPVVTRTSVFARVTPEQKLRLVRSLQAQGHIVAMTGDGVNDAPALRQADIGVAMGISGTDVAKGAADMVLTDDNFASIVAAVEEGRSVYDNLTKFIVWTLPTNSGEAMIILTAIMFGISLPVVPVQLLWVNMMTAVLLGLILVFEPKESGLMHRPPRPAHKPILTGQLAVRTGLVTLIMIVGAFWLFSWEMSRQGETIDAARTAVINVIVLIETAYLFNCRSLNQSFFTMRFFSNPLIIVGACAMLGVQLLFTYTPVMNRLFHTAPISVETWLRIAGVAILAFSVVEIEKWLRLRYQGNRE